MQQAEAASRCAPRKESCSTETWKMEECAGSCSPDPAFRRSQRRSGSSREGAEKAAGASSPSVLPLHRNSASFSSGTMMHRSRMCPSVWRRTRSDPPVPDPSQRAAAEATRCVTRRAAATTTKRSGLRSGEDRQAGHVRGCNTPLHLHAPDARARARTHLKHNATCKELQ